ARERHGDLEGLLAIAHVHRVGHAHAAFDVGAQPLPAFRLQLAEQLPEPRPADLGRLAHVRAHKLVAEIGGEHAPSGKDGGHPRDDHARDPEHARPLGHVQPAAPPKASSAKRRGSAPRRTETMRMPSAMFVLTTRWMPSAAATVVVPSRFATAATARSAALASRRARPPRKLAGSRKPRTTLASVTVAAAPPW